MNIAKTGCEPELTGTQVTVSSHILASQVEDILLFSQIQEALADLAQDQERREEYDMQIIPRNDIEAYFGNERPEFFESQRNISYPAKLVQALEGLYDEYDEAFKKLIEKNMESSQDYAGEGELVRKNYCVQIDMIGLPGAFLEKVEQGCYSDAVLKEVLRRRIFEIENSLAAYSLLRNIDSLQRPTIFEEGLNRMIDSLRELTGKKIIVLTLSEEKYRAVLQFDAGIPEGIEKDVVKIRRNTGFDDIYGPEELQRAYEMREHNLYYVRASLEKERLKNPNGSFENAFLSDEKVRRYVKQRALTYNIDAPDGDYERVINDSKEYMPDLGMGYVIESLEDIYTSEYRDFLQQKQKTGSFAGIVFSPGFLHYLRYVGCSEEEIQSGNIEFHIKPLKCAYGAYGHISGDFRESEKRAKLKKELTKRKKCIVQIRMKNSSCQDSVSGREFIYIDRIFLYRDAKTQKIQYMGGFRNHMPLDSQDGKKGIVHGSTQTVYAPIASDFNYYR